MMFQKLLLAISAIVLLAIPNVAVAQRGHDNGPDKKAEQSDGKSGGDHGGPQRAQRPAAPQAQAAPQAAPQREARPQRDARPERQAAPQAAPQRQAQPQRDARPGRQAAPQAAPQRDAGPRAQGGFQNGRAAPDQSPRAASHGQQATQWHSTNPNWNRGTVWQRNPNWWRGNSGFRNYSGVRLNFFFAPGYGYYGVSREYQGRSWHPGEYLPEFFLRYVVNDYRAYGLPAPPYGFSWIWVNTSVLLVDRSDGYILDEVDNVW